MRNSHPAVRSRSSHPASQSPLRFLLSSLEILSLARLYQSRDFAEETGIYISPNISYICRPRWNIRTNARISWPAAREDDVAMFEQRAGERPEGRKEAKAALPN